MTGKQSETYRERGLTWRGERLGESQKGLEFTPYKHETTHDHTSHVKKKGRKDGDKDTGKQLPTPLSCSLTCGSNSVCGLQCNLIFMSGTISITNPKCKKGCGLGTTHTISITLFVRCPMTIIDGL